MIKRGGVTVLPRFLNSCFAVDGHGGALGVRPESPSLTLGVRKKPGLASVLGRTFTGRRAACWRGYRGMWFCAYRVVNSGRTGLHKPPVPGNL